MRTPKIWDRVSPGNLARVSNLWPVLGTLKTVMVKIDPPIDWLLIHPNSLGSFLYI